MSGDTSTDTIADDKLVSSIDIDELCEVIDSEVDSVIKMESSSAATTPKSANDSKSVKTEASSSPAPSKHSAGARKRQGEADDNIENMKKPKIVSDGNEEYLNESASSEMTQELDIWDEDPKGLYGLSPKFLKEKGIRTPLTNWVHLSNIPCDKSILREVMELAGNVLICHVVRTKTGYAKVKYSHPIEAAQAVSMLNGQTLIGKTLCVSIDPGPHQAEFLPVGLKKVGPGFSKTGKPLKDVVRHLERHLRGKPTSLSGSLFEADDVKPDEEEINEINDSETKTDESKNDKIENAVTETTKTETAKTDTAGTDTSVTKSVSNVTKDKISQTDDDGNKKIIEIVNEIRKKGVAVYEIINALKALKARDSSDTKRESSQPKSTSSDSKDDSKEKHVSRSVFPKKVPSRLSARSVSPKRIHHSPSFGPRSGSSGSFRPNAPHFKNFHNAGPNNDGPRMNKPNFGPSNGNFGPGPNPGPFNNFGPQGHNGPPNNGPFFQQSGPGNVGNSGPQPFGGNFQNPGNVGMNAGPGPFGGNPGPGPNQQFGGNFGPQQNFMGPGVPNEQRSTSNVVVLNNLPPSVTIQLLTEKMNTCGEVQYMNVTKPGTAMVRYAHDWEAVRCISTFDKTVVDGHKIEVRFA